MARILVTGGAGFIGSNYLHRAVPARPGDRFICLDALTYAGNLANLEPVRGAANFEFVRGSITDEKLVGEIVSGGVEGIVNFAAETHVDRSIGGAGDFIETNVMGTRVLLDAARAHGVSRFVQISTDEVYGSLGPSGRFTERSPLDPSSPYSASKTAADLLALAYFRTWGVPVLVTRCSNNYGPYQFPEKLIPLFVTNAMTDEPLPLYGDGLNVRDWIHVADHSRAVDAVYTSGRPGEVYNVGGGNERTNREITELLLDALGKPRDLIRLVADRPGHDRRYAIDSSKIEGELGWRPEVEFARGLRETVEWYRANRAWWEAVKSGAYRDYYASMYGERLARSRGGSD